MKYKIVLNYGHFKITVELEAKSLPEALRESMELSKAHEELLVKATVYKLECA